ncbi:MAG TPA: restriction endonuclease subunit S [Terracidiphilus sp.]|nr:restriction endonuclease subunit S [Terracidiphilus sp.]
MPSFTRLLVKLFWNNMMTSTEKWAEVRLFDIAKCQGGSAFSPSLQGRKSGELPFFKVSDMNLPENRWTMHCANNYVNRSDRVHINGSEKPAGSVIFPKVGAAIFTNKKRLLLQPAFIDNNVMAVWLTSPERCIPAFLYLHFLTIELSELSNPGPLPSINNSKIQELTISLPPLSEQERIAAVLWKIQRAIEVEEKLIATARELKQSAMRQLFTKGFRDEPQKASDIGRIPSSWNAVPLGSLGRIGNGSTPLKTNPAYWENGTIPWLTSAKVYDVTVRQADQYVTAKAVQECHLPRVQPGSVLMAITGQGKTLGHVAVTAIETCVSQHIAYIQFNNNQIVPHFVRLFLESRYDELRGIAQGGGSTKGALTCGFLKTFLIPLPKPDEQARIASVLLTIEDKASVHERRRTMLQELFRTMLHQLMTGEIRVNKLDIDVSEIQP